MEKRFECVNLVIDGAVATVQLNRPEKKNAMSPQLHQDMNDALTAIEEQDGVKVVVVTGVGDSFCGGMDLEKCFLEPFDDPDEFTRVNDIALTWFRRLKAFPAVTLASVNGWCFGGGVELVGICDLAIAAEEAVFGLSEINFGIFPGGGTMWAAAHNLNRKQALYYSLTGETFNGRQAAELGLVNRAVPASQLAAETRRVSDMLVNKNIHTLRATKEVYERAIFMDFPESVEWEMAKLQELSYRSRHAWVRQALTQFRERRFRPGLESYALGEGEGEGEG
ncbi:MAG: p-hydroxycinnamoyl CoA hydratase/lyase [Bacillota bacterium]|nr:p-hydroxycinnamoyl CoA hydratase/lyase [Bacillota bacterium]